MPSLNMVGDMFGEHTVLAFDLETTGIDTKRDRIVQYAFIGSDKSGGEIRVEELVYPQQKIPIESSRIHGIYDDDVKGLSSFSAHVEKIEELVNGAVIVGHNVRRFDLPFLGNEYSRSGSLVPKPVAVIDTLELARRLKLPRPHNLGALCSRYGIDLTNAHTASADAAATLLLLWKLMCDHPQPFRQSLDEIERWLQGTSTIRSASELGRDYNDLIPLDSRGRLRVDGSDIVLAFGRHRGRTIEEVHNNDKSYFDWLISPSGGLNEEAIQTIRQRFQD